MLKELVEMANVQQLRRSPLAARTQELQQASGTAAALREIPFTTQVGLRATPGTDGHAALAEALGGLPAKVGDVVGDSNATGVLWLSPDEFLAIGSPDSQLVDACPPALIDRSSHVRDPSANRTIIDPSGDAAELVLPNPCPLDSHQRTSPPTPTYLTKVAHTPQL